MCSWEHSEFEAQDQLEEKMERHYKPDLQLWQDVQWFPMPLYTDPLSEFSPLVGVIPSETPAT